MRRVDFEHIYDENLGRVYGFVARRVKTRQDAEDLTQETFEHALGAWDRFDPRRASAATWLLAIAGNLVVDHYRAQRPEGPSLEDVDPASLPSVAETGPRLGLEPGLAGALGALPKREQEILALRFAGDLTGKEIAELTGLSLANVQQIVSRSLRRLHLALAA